MKTLLSYSRHVAVALATLLLFSQTAFGADGTWTALSSGDASGTWATSGNWSGSTIAGGSGFTADFNTLNITTNSTVTLDTPTTIGNLTFGDTGTGTAASWILSNGGTATNTLTLSATTPTITVNSLGTGASVQMDAVITGTNGLIKSGIGKLVLNQANTYTGTLTNVNFGLREFGTIINRGRVVLGNATGAGSGDILLNGVSYTATLDLNGQTVANNIALRSDTYLENSNTNAAAVVNGTVTVNSYGRIGSIASDGLGTMIVNGAVSFADTNHSLFLNSNGGLTVLNGSNGQGIYSIQGGTLRANDGTGVNTSAKLIINGGVLETGANVTRSLGTAFGQIDVGSTNSGANNGFSAYGNAVTISLGGIGSPTAITWGTGNFLTNASTLVLNTATANDTLTFANALDLNGATRTISAQANTAIISGNISNGTGTAGLTKTGEGTLSLTGTNTYNGGTTVSAGTLQVNTSSLPGNVTNNAALVFNQSSAGTFGSVISGTGTVDKTGAGNLTLSGVNTHTGATTVSQGTLTLGNSTALGATNGNTTVAAGATIDLNGQNIGGEEVRINGTGVGGNGALVNNGTASATGLRLTALSDATIGGTNRIDTAYSGTVINAGINSLTKIGTSSFIINVGTTSMGTFFVNEGTVVAVNSATPFGDTSYGTSVANGASLQFYNSSGSEIINNEAITLANGAELAGTTATSQNTINGAISLTGSQANIRVENNGIATLKLGGVISGAGGINKTSSGILLLTGVNTYTGNTTVTGGTVSLADNAEMRFVIGANGVNNGVDGTGSLNLDGDFRFDLTGAGTTLGNTWQIVNTATLSETFGSSFQALSTLGAFSESGGIWSITENGVTYEFTEASGSLTVVPEPSTYLLVTLGLALVLLHSRRRTA